MQVRPKRGYEPVLVRGYKETKNTPLRLISFLIYHLDNLTFVLAIITLTFDVGNRKTKD